MNRFSSELVHRHIIFPLTPLLLEKLMIIGRDNTLQVNEKICNLEREYRDCIKSRRDKIGITRHIMMHQVLYNVHVTLFIGQLHNI